MIKVMRIASIAILLVGAVVVGGCARLSDSPEAVAEGALRSSAGAIVAPLAYRSGLIPKPLADAWIERVESDYGQWYGSPMLDSMVTGIHNVVGALATQPGPIAASVDISSMAIPPASVNGDEATVPEAMIAYVTHYVPGSWGQTDVPGSTMCTYTLHRTKDGWRVTDGSCNVSGG
jgi:hypothetical protein